MERHNTVPESSSVTWRPGYTPLGYERNAHSVDINNTRVWFSAYITPGDPRRRRRLSGRRTSSHTGSTTAELASTCPRSIRNLRGLPNHRETWPRMP